MAHPSTAFHTADMVRDLVVEDRPWPRYETLYGELVVTPAPRALHQHVVGELFVALHGYLDPDRVGKLFASPADVSWGRRDLLVQPDLFVVDPAAWRAMRDGADWSAVRQLLLAVEILSPSTERRDRFAKRRLYQQQGVPLYWAIDLDDRSAAVWTPDDELPRVEREQLTWHPAGAPEPLVVTLSALLDG